MNFVAIDFETANLKPASACAVGLAVVENATIVETFYSLIRPTPFRFNPKFTAIHGITAADVRHEMTFDKLWPEIKKRIDGRTLLGHNASFDRNVLLACLDTYNLKFKSPEFLCTLRLARSLYPGARTNKLTALCRRLKIPINHHHAEADAIACARAAILISKRKGVSLAACRLPPQKS